MRALARGSFVQLQVLHALILRETRTRFGASQIGYVWAILEPLLWIGTLGFVYQLTQRAAPPGMTMLGFLATGLIPYQLFRECSTRVMVAVSSNRALLFYPQVRPLDLMMSRVTLEGATYFSIFVIILGGEALLLGAAPINEPLKVLMGLGLAAGLGGTLGAVLCSLSVFSASVERVAGVLLRPLFWVSGVFFSAQDLPPNALELLLYNPLLHVVELTRDGWAGSYHSARVNGWYPLTFILVLGFLALVLERAARPRIEVT